MPSAHYAGRCNCNGTIWAPSSEFVSSSIPSWQILTVHAQIFRGARDLAFCLKVPLDSLLVWVSSEGSGESARMLPRYYQGNSNDIPGMTLTYFMPRSNLVPYAFLVYYIKVGSCSQLNEYMKLYEYQRSRSFIDLDPNPSDSIFLIFFSSISADFNILSTQVSNTGPLVLYRTIGPLVAEDYLMNECHTLE